MVNNNWVARLRSKGENDRRGWRRREEPDHGDPLCIVSVDFILGAVWGH